MENKISKAVTQMLDRLLEYAVAAGSAIFGIVMLASPENNPFALYGAWPAWMATSWSWFMVVGGLSMFVGLLWVRFQLAGYIITAIPLILYGIVRIWASVVQDDTAGGVFLILAGTAYLIRLVRVQCYVRRREVSRFGTK